MKPLEADKNRPLEGGASYPISHRLFRLTWAVVWLFLASWTPAPLHRWRIALLRVAGARVHSTAHVYGSARVWYPPDLIMEAHSCLGPKVNCYNMAPIRLGRGAIVSQGSYLCAGSHDIEDPNFQLVVKPISVGANAWVAAEAFIGPGVSVGDNAVIGARSVLFANAVASGVYVGNPAVQIKSRSAMSKRSKKL